MIGHTRRSRADAHIATGAVRLAASALLAGLLVAGPAAAHDTAVGDGRDVSRCKRCPDIKRAVVEHTSDKLTFRVRTYRKFSSKSPLAPTIEVEAGAIRYRLTPKGGSTGAGAKFPVEVSRNGRRSITYAVSVATPKTLSWRARIDKKGKTADKAPNKGLATHTQPGQPAPPAAPPAAPQPLPQPSAQTRTNLRVSGAQAVNFTDDGACTAYKDPSGDTQERSWKGAWSTFANDRAWIIEMTLQRGQYRGAGTYSFPGEKSDDHLSPPTLFNANWLRFTDGALTSWHTFDTPVAVAGTMTLGPDLRSGTVDATSVNKDDGTQVKVVGSFYCESFDTD